MRTALTALALVLVTIAGLRAMGRVWWCSQGDLALGSFDVWSAHNSQHLIDPYFGSHLLHGLLFYAAGHLWLRERCSHATRALLALGLECGWELLENTSLVIGRYRESTMSLDYNGDSIVNSLGDLAACALGYGLAASVPLAASVAGFVIVEVVMLAWIRDSLLLNVWMLAFSTEAIKRWQAGG